MTRWLKVTFLAGIVTGCVTVSQLETGNGFDNIKAADARITLGLSYLEVGDRQKARENLELAIKYAPNYYRSLNSIAYYYQLVGEVHLAEQAFKKAMRESPENSELLNNYGAFLCRLGQYEQADAFFNRAIEQKTNYRIVDSMENAAICALKSGNSAQAEYYFSRSLDYDPYRYFSLLHYCKLMLAKGKDNQARIRLIRFHQKFGYQPGSLALLIKIEERAGNREQAEKYTRLLEQG